MSEAFDRCQSEAQAAFGDGSLFVEKLISRPRHIEVQILADAHGNVVHLHERDCSVQLRHQKVVEVAPAPALDEALRERILADAIKLARAAEYVNAGTVEFLVSPETGEHFFIECNPRIQVEHTVTEQVTGVDLVEAQFHIASGASLESLGLGDQDAVGDPRGFAVQARVVATGAGTITAYKEPSGAGVRVDASGYLGYSPPPQFDPLLAKLIASSGSASSFQSAVARTRAALAEFHIAGLPTNLSQLRAILAHSVFAAGDARTTFLAEEHETLVAGPASSSEGDALALLEQQASTVVGREDTGTSSLVASRLPALEVPDGQLGVECPVSGSVLEVRLRAGDTVAAGDPLLIISAMKM
jgi:pyruvate carboxylase